MALIAGARRYTRRLCHANTLARNDARACPLIPAMQIIERDSKAIRNRHE